MRHLLYRAAICLVGSALLGGGQAACSSGPPPPVETRSYEQDVLAFRASKDSSFRAAANKDSPIPAAERSTFPGLAYYPVDATYHVPAALREESTNPPVVILMPTSQNLPRRMQKVGTLRFTIAGQEQTLSAFVEAGQSLERLFVPFADLTTGGETYHGGRSLELDRTVTGLYDLDFNRAYHPYCLYNASYDCPIPPRENRLPVAIRAGERLRP